MDKMLTAGRLALVEDRVAGTSPAESLWRVAGRYAEEAEQRDISRAAMELVIKRLDAAADAPDHPTDGKK